MTLAGVQTIIAERGTGLAAAADTPPAILGVAASGAAAVATLVSRQEDLVSAYGSGPLVELAALYLAVARKPVVCVPVARAAVGVAGAVTQTGTGASVLTITGDPIDRYSVLVEILRGAANPAANQATFRVSLDGGKSYSPELALPTSGVYALPGTGMSLNFSAASLVAGDTYAFATTAPTFTSAELTPALDALAAYGEGWEFVHPAQALDQPLATVVENWLDTLAADNRFHWALGESRDQNGGESVSAWETAITGASPGFQGFVATRGDVAITAGYGDVESALRIGGQDRRPISWSLGPRCAAIPLSEHPGRVLTGVLPRLAKVYHDLRTYSSLDARRFCGVQTISGRPASEFYATARTFAADGTDISTIPRARVLCLAARTALRSLTTRINSSVALNDDGTIRELDARQIEAETLADLEAALIRVVTGQHVSAINVTVDRTWNVGASDTLRVSISFTPLGYATAINLTLGFRLRTAE